MALEPKSFWVPRDAGCLTNGEMAYNNSSRVESKRGRQWFVDPSGEEILSSKKQVIDSGLPNANVSPWGNNTSTFQPVPCQFTNRLFHSEPESIQTVNLVDINDSSVGDQNMSMRREDFGDQFLKNPSVSLSMVHAAEDPSSCLSFGGIRKVKVNEVREPDNAMHVSIGHSYSRGDNNYSDPDFHTVSLASTYNNSDENTIPVGPTLYKGEGRFMVMGQDFSKGDESNLSMGPPVDKGDNNFISIGQLFGKGPNYVMSMAPSYSKAHENFISMGSCYNKESDNIISTGQAYSKDDSNTISFGGFHDEPETDPSGGIVSGYELLMSSQNVAQSSGEPGQKDLVEANVEPVNDNTQENNTEAGSSSKNKEPKTTKKLPPNNFPANVKSLLSTGMLDGVRVKYVSWSREKNLHGIIKGSGYMCGCDDCQFSKALNAYEFERHAGCKTKHPNNHIYFGNGKTIYAVVQELKSTPLEALFDAIQNVTGSSINQKNFRIWKASFQAATLELQRIYGKEEVRMPC